MIVRAFRKAIKVQDAQSPYDTIHHKVFCLDCEKKLHPLVDADRAFKLRNLFPQTAPHESNSALIRINYLLQYYHKHKFTIIAQSS